MQVVKVRLRKPRRVLTMLCRDVHLDRGDTCVVRSERGLEWGTCILPPEPCARDMERRFTDQVVRLANEDDIKTFDVLAEEERKARKICLEKIREHAMDMKLVDVEYTFDKKKIVFYFTAEERVDFRELVRDLAHDLRTRIELRHIQVRDEAKMVGGLGTCGRELCCSSWLEEFRPISMRMAKRQNLSLNPSKISGQCGRLLCCLSYENDQYESIKRRAKQAKPDAAPLPEPEGEKKKSAPAESRETPKPRPAEETRKEQAAPEREEAPVLAETTKPEESVPAEAKDTGDQGEGKGKKRSGRRRRRRKPRGGKKDGEGSS